MAIDPKYRAQIEAQKAKAEANKARMAEQRAAQQATYDARGRVPIYGVGKGMDVYYAPGQTPGPSRTQANGREISGYWDKQYGYVPTNWQRPTVGQTLVQDGRVYKGRTPPDWMMPGYTGAPVAGPRQGWSPDGSAPPTQQSAPRPPSGSVPLPPGQGPVPMGGGQPPPGQQSYVGLPPGITVGGGNKTQQPWFHVQQDPMAVQMAQAQALRG